MSAYQHQIRHQIMRIINVAAVQFSSFTLLWQIQKTRSINRMCLTLYTING